ncbi:MAG TPA: hypothetical protein VF511_12110 [Chthoniobacterales bacterium]|jgi:hypothetical protein
MNKLFVLAVLASAARFSLAAEPDMNPCTFFPKEEIAKIIGEIKEGPKPKEGLMKEKECEWTNMSGSWLSVGLYSSDKWELKKGSANNPAEVKGLGEEAFTDKRGTDAEIYVRKGKWMLEVRTSSGSANARKVAEYAVAKMP